MTKRTKTESLTPIQLVSHYRRFGKKFLLFLLRLNTIQKGFGSKPLNAVKSFTDQTKQVNDYLFQ